MTHPQQALNLERVSQRISALIVSFCADRVGRDFHLSELAGFVSRHVLVSPDSASRILRDLRAKHVIRYSVVSRKLSLYHVDSVQPKAA